VETAEVNDLYVRDYLYIALSDIPSMGFRCTPERLKLVMPWNDCMLGCFEQNEQ
jgi:hypothetical protein